MATTEKLTAKMISLAQLKLSDSNPRKNFDEPALKGLAMSLAFKGMINPITVTPKGVVVAGARRYMAAKLAKLKEVPCIVKDLTDPEILQVQITENLQRADVHPMEEAEAFRLLLKHPDLTLEKVAANVGKDRAYVTQRIKLLSLIPEFKKLFLSGKIFLGHALELCRLQPEQQKKLLDWNIEAMTVDDLRNSVRREFFLDLTKANFNTGDAKLVAEAGACADCTKRTGNNRALFADVKSGDTCTDNACFENKLQKHILVQIKSGVIPVAVGYVHDAKQLPEGTKKEGSYTEVGKKDVCSHAQAAIIVNGYMDKGRAMTICTAKECPDHAEGGRDQSNGKMQSNGMTKEQNEKRKLDQKVRIRTLLAIRENLKAPARADYEQIATSIFARYYSTLQAKVLGILGWKPEPKKDSYTDKPKAFAKGLDEIADKDFPKFIVFLSLCNVLDNAPYEGKDPVKEYAKSLEIDTKAIVDELSKPKEKKEKAEAEPKKAPRKQARAKKAGK